MSTQAESTQKQVIECLDYCKSKGISAITLVFPFGIAPGALALLRANEIVKGVVVRGNNCQQSGFAPGEIGEFLPGDWQWQLPDSAASTVVFIGPRSYLSSYAVLRALRRGVRRIIYRGRQAWYSESTSGFFAYRLAEYLQHTVYRSWYRFKELWKALEKRSSLVAWLGANLRILTSMVAEQIDSYAIAKVVRCFGQYNEPLIPKNEFRPGRVMLVNASLAWGGAERQIVNTLIGLKSRGITDTSLVTVHLNDRPDHDFYLWQLQEMEIEVRQLNSVSGYEDVIDPRVAAILHGVVESLPRHCADEVCNYALEFIRCKPEVVHAWQDSTSILAGIAAVLVGVPKIVLASRNMPPFNFAYYHSYMKPAYRALAARDNVVLINNSFRGAREYARWLKLDESRYRVVFNGISDENLTKPLPSIIADYKQKLGINAGAPVVGSVFRFYDEKDPLLWVSAISIVSRRRPDVRYLLIGAGPMREEIVNAAAREGIGNRLFMPGADKYVALPISAMDVFLLTSRHEGTPNVLIEAQMLGVPVVATDVGGVPDTVDNGASGFVVETRDPEILAERVVYILDNPAWRTKAEVRGEEFARQRFGVDRMIDETLATYGFASNQSGVST